MVTLQLALDRAPAELRPGLKEIVAEYPQRFKAKGALALQFVADPALAAGALAVTTVARQVTIAYSTKTSAFRALGRVMGAAATGDRQPAFREHARLELMGIMPDCSRNGVLTIPAAKALLRRISLMGLNMMILYTEDTYEVPGEPFFGYLRGAYTYEELKELDDYADAFGVEMFPCIQTLAHLEQILQWPCYAQYRDIGSVLIAEEEPTYALLEKMIAAAARPFRSKRIHLGMDEAHGIGDGRYKERHGDKRRLDILNTHLARVRDLCRKQGLHPMIWSDMYFRLGSKTHDYYDAQWSIPADAIAQIPKDVQLVYWDYYHPEAATYSDFIAKHRSLGTEPVVAGGVWTWNHFWAALPWTFTTVKACMTACREQHVHDVFMTMWGDDGMEVDLCSALPGLQYFAEHAYADAVDEKLLRANFRGTCDGDFDDWVAAAAIDAPPAITHPEKSCNNVSKWLLYHDPVLSFLEPTVLRCQPRAHYQKLATRLFAAAKGGGAARRLLFPAWIAQTLALKVQLRHDLAAAYQADDRAKLRRLLKGDVTACRKAMRTLWRCHRDVWMSLYKPFGWETVERRYGGVMARLETLADRLTAYLDRRLDALPELAVELRDVYPEMHDELPWSNYFRAATPSCIK